MQKIIIDNRTEQELVDILSCIEKIEDIKNKVQIVKVDNKLINCSVIQNEKSFRYLFSYQKDIQGQLF